MLTNKDQLVSEGYLMRSYTLLSKLCSLNIGSLTVSRSCSASVKTCQRAYLHYQFEAVSISLSRDINAITCDDVRYREDRF